MAAEPDAGRTEANARAAEASAQPDAEPLLREALAKIEAAGAARLDAPADDGIVRLLERIEDEARHAASDAAVPARSDAELLLREALTKIGTARRDRGAAPSDADAARLLQRIASEARRIRETVEANDRKAKRESFRALAAELRSKTAAAPRVPSEVLIREDRDRRRAST